MPTPRHSFAQQLSTYIQGTFAVIYYTGYITSHDRFRKFCHAERLLLQCHEMQLPNQITLRCFKGNENTFVRSVDIRSWFYHSYSSYASKRRCFSRCKVQVMRVQTEEQCYFCCPLSTVCQLREIKDGQQLLSQCFGMRRAYACSSFAMINGARRCSTPSPCLNTGVTRTLFGQDGRPQTKQVQQMPIEQANSTSMLSIQLEGDARALSAGNKYSTVFKSDNN